MVLALTWLACRNPISVDTNLPEVFVTLPIDGAVVQGTVHMTAVADDPVGVASVRFLVDGEEVDSGEQTNPQNLAEWSGEWASTVAVDGDHRISAVATDNADNDGEASVDVVVFNGLVDPGVLRVLYPTDGATVCSAVPIEALVAVSASQVEFFVDDVLLATDTSAPWVTTWDAPTAGAGAHGVRIVLTTTDGIVVQRRVEVEVGDGCDAAPAVMLTAPGNGSIVSGDVTLSASAQDDVGVVKVQFFADNGLVSDDATTPWSIVMSAASLGEGEHPLKAIVTDTSGQTTSSTERTVLIDLTAPTVQIVRPGDGEQLSGIVTLGAEAEDSIGLQGVNFRVDGVPLGASLTLPYTLDWDTSGVAAGSHLVEAIAVDTAGNYSEPAGILVIVDNAPSLSITPEDGATVSGDFAITAVPTDDGTIVSVRAALDGVDLGTPATFWEWHVNGCGLEPGAYAIEVVATDDGGNTASASATIALVNDATALEICDGADNDCDGLVDEGDDLDADGYVECEGDCDDTDPAISPDGVELCGTGRDEDCDGTSDEEDAADAATWYADADGDGYGGDVTALACTIPSGYVATAGDCDDTSAAANPDGVEVCDGVDNDCNAEADDGFDADGDGVSPCGGADCDDADPTIYAGASEICGDGIDQDCDEGPGDCGVDGTLALAAADGRLNGTAADDHAGTSLSAAGDVDGDGYDDLLVGAPIEDGAGSSAGAAYLVRGPFVGDAALADAWATFRGDTSSDYAGRSVASAGDVDDDGLADILIGADLDDGGASDAGAVYLLLSPDAGAVSLTTANATILGVVAGDHAGAAVAGGEDLDGDGVPDIVTGAYAHDAGGADAGAVYIIGGDAAGVVSLGSADAVLVGEAAGDATGSAVASVGDVDGDGLGDLLIGGYGSDAGGSNAGIAYLVLGGASGTVSLAAADARLIGEDADDATGQALAAAGDVDGDGLADLLVGAAFADDSGGQSGVAYVVLGAPSGDVDLSAADARLVGESGGDYAGYAVAGAGDVDRDGFSDVLVGAPSRDEGSVDCGVAYLVRGPMEGSMPLASADARLVGEAASDVAAIAVSGAGDTDGDGFDDIAIGANRAEGPASDAGVVYLFTGGGL